MALPTSIGAPSGSSSKTNVDSKVPQTTTNGDAPATHDAAHGGPLPPCDPPAVRKQFIGTVAGDSQRKPFSVK